ncbi:unnamed protein product, partial [marine sediment metagenome]
MAKKRLKAKKPAGWTPKADTAKKPQQPQLHDRKKDPEQQIKALIEKGKSKGYLTYEEMN